jgi:hypothetical protein
MEDLKEFILGKVTYTKVVNLVQYENYFKNAKEYLERLWLFFDFRNRKMLDVRCWTGAKLIHFSTDSAEIETYPRATEFARSLELKVIETNPENLPLPIESFQEYSTNM